MNSAILSDSLLRWIQEVAQAHMSISSNVLNFNIIQMYFFLYINPVKVLLKSSLSIFFLNQAFQPLVHSKYSCYNHFHQEILQFFVHQIIVSLDHIQV